MLAPATSPASAQRESPLPTPVTNNTVASGRVAEAWWIFSALGVDSTKRWSGITRRAVAWSSRTQTWRTLPDVSGAEGRLAATSQVVRGKWFVFGGYTVDSAGHEHSVPAVDIYDPVTNHWKRGRDMPVPVDDAVSGVYHDSLVYIISGWHETDSVRDVQLYDVVRDVWSSGTPIPGPGVFGHTGELSGQTIVFIDGAVRQEGPVRFRSQPQTWVGTIDAGAPTRITWREGPPHPGPPLYRAAAGRCGQRLIFAGGTSNPFNYNGIGYDGQPSTPSAAVMGFDTQRTLWQSLTPMAVATMDHRALAVVGDTGWVVAGMRAHQRVAATAEPVPLGSCAP